MLCERYDEDKSFLTIQTSASEKDPKLAQAIRASAINNLGRSAIYLETGNYNTITGCAWI